MKNNVHLIKERFDQFRQIKTKMNTRKKKNNLNLYFLLRRIKL